MNVVISNRDILFPLCAQVMLTFSVLAYLWFVRFSAMAKSRFNPRKMGEHELYDNVFKEIENVNYNFENLFEIPVLFYALIPVLCISGVVDACFVWCAWVFVICRILHSIVHCTSNNLTHRVSVFAISSLFLLFMWLRFLWIIIGASSS